MCVCVNFAGAMYDDSGSLIQRPMRKTSIVIIFAGCEQGEGGHLDSRYRRYVGDT